MSGEFPAASPKVRATLYLPQDLLEEARDAAVHLGGFPVRLTLTKFAECALSVPNCRGLKTCTTPAATFRRETRI